MYSIVSVNQTLKMECSIILWGNKHIKISHEHKRPIKEGITFLLSFQKSNQFEMNTCLRKYFSWSFDSLVCVCQDIVNFESLWVSQLIIKCQTAKFLLKFLKSLWLCSNLSARNRQQFTPYFEGFPKLLHGTVVVFETTHDH